MRSLFRRVSAAVLALMMVFTFMPLLGGYQAFAGGGYDISGILKGGDSSGNVTAGEMVYVLQSDLDNRLGTDVKKMVDNGELELKFTIDDGMTSYDESATYDSSGKRFYYVTKPGDAGKSITFYTDAITADTSYNNNTESLNIVAGASSGPDSSATYLIRSSVPNADGSFVLTGNSPSSPFKCLRVFDGEGKMVEEIYSDVNYKNYFSFLFDVSSYDVGYYNMIGVLQDNTTVDLSFYSPSEDNFYTTYFMSGIYETPVIKKNSNFFSTGSNYVCFRPYFSVDPELGGIYLQLYDTKANLWGDIYGPFGSYEILRTNYFIGNKKDGGTKILQNRTYKARVFYAKQVKYGGFDEYIYGPYSNVISFKTGKSSKPAIKSITAKVKKVKKVKLIQKAHWDVNGKWVPYKESYTWTTTYKVTVKLKKKPGTAGIYIGNKSLKGNKTTYTATFTDSGKLKGKKVTFAICTYNDAKLGAYGPTVKKKVKIK